jgi:hypothetical protein
LQKHPNPIDISFQSDYNQKVLKTVYIGQAKKGRIYARSAAERKPAAERFLRKRRIWPARSIAVKNRGVSRVKG